MDKINKARDLMHHLHDGVKDEFGLMISDQIQGTVEKIQQFYDGKDKEDVIVATYLHKALNGKYVKTSVCTEEGKSPIRFEYLKKYFGYSAARMVFDLSLMPDDRLVSKGLSNVTRLDLAKSHWVNTNSEEDVCKVSLQEIQFKAIGLWAKNLKPSEQAILLADKLSSFEALTESVRVHKSSSWFRRYYEKQMIVLDAIKEASPIIHTECIREAEEGLKHIKIIERRNARSVEKRNIAI